VAGEITTQAYVDVLSIVRSVIHDIGYNDPELQFDSRTVGVFTAIHQQSPDIAQGVDTGGAGDQGMMFGYACLETPELMPAPIEIAHKLARRLSEVRRKGILPYLRPDGKTQVTVRYDGGKAIGVETIVVSAQHHPDIKMDKLREDLKREVIFPVVPADMRKELKEERIFTNPTGVFAIGGPAGDTGLTGRKIIVDTYGGYAPHGGGAFSGKDPTKVDRSAAYAARWVAKNVVAAGFSDRCQLQVAYAIGVAEPVSIRVDTFGTGKISDRDIERAIHSVFDLRPLAIIEKLNLRRPIYRQTAAYGHFGRVDKLDDFTWEKTDRVADLQKAAGR